MAKIGGQFMTKTAENRNFSDDTYLYSPYKEVPSSRDKKCIGHLVLKVILPR